jgi:hypothetical protein
MIRSDFPARHPQPIHSGPRYFNCDRARFRREPNRLELHSLSVAQSFVARFDRHGKAEPRKGLTGFDLYLFGPPLKFMVL